MTSKISLHSVSIDATYPIAGVNQSSAGFRSNFDAIKLALTEGDSEITKLQSKVINFAGDATGTSGAFSDTNTPNTATLTLATVLSTPGSFATSANDISMVVDAKGRITSASQVALSNNVNTATTYEISATALGSGSGAATFPTFRFDAAGRLKTVGTKSVSFGLLNHVLTKGKLLAGGNGNISVEVPAPAAYDSTYVLSATGAGLSGLEWVPLNLPSGAILSLTEGPGIDISGSPGATVKLDVATLSTATIVDADSLPFHSVSNTASRRTTLSAFKTYLAGTFLNSDVGATAITSTHSNGVVITSGNGITLNALKWPTSVGTQDQVLTIGASNQMVWGGSSRLGVYRTLYVSSGTGNDTTGSGGVAEPYATITKALQQTAVNSNAYSIVVMGGSYAEAVAVNRTNVMIAGFGGAVKPVLTGAVTVASGTTSVGFRNITFDQSAQSSGTSIPAVAAASGLGDLTFDNCDFYRGSGAKALQPIVNLAGTLTGGVVFDNCAFQGQLVFTLTSSTNQVSITNTRQIQDYEFGIETSTNLFVRAARIITGIKHLDGVMNLEEVAAVVSKSMSVTIPNAPVWLLSGSDPQLKDGNPGVGGIQPIALSIPEPVLSSAGLPIQDSDGLGSPLFLADGVTPIYKMTAFQQDFSVTTSTSTQNVGIHSTSETGQLLMTNVNLFNGNSYAKIVKTGEASWRFNGVNRWADQDVIRGPRISHEVRVDSGNYAPSLYANGTTLKYTDVGDAVFSDGKIDPRKGKIFTVELRGNSSITLKSPQLSAFPISQNGASLDMIFSTKVIVKQDATGYRKATWGADGGYGITWHGDNQSNPEPLSYTLFTFYYYTATRRWIGIKTGSGSGSGGGLGIVDQSGSTFTPTLTHANKYIRLSYGTTTNFVVPNNAAVPYGIGTCLYINQASTGKVLISAQSSVVINSPESHQSRKSYSLLTLTKVATNTWDLAGDLEEAIVRADNVAITSDLTSITSDSG